MTSIHWMIPDFIFQGHEKSVAVLETIPLASLRMRAFPAIKAMEGKGAQVTLGEYIAGKPSKIFVSKIGSIDAKNRTPSYLDQLRQHTSSGAQLYIDYTDHHLGSLTPMTAFYQEAIKIADAATVSSSYMRNLLREFYDGKIAVIEDALDITAQPIKTTPQKERTLLWFGHESNIQYLIDFVRTGFEPGDVAKVLVLSSIKGLELFRAAPLQSNAKLEFLLLNWSPGQMLEAARHCDACILPIDCKDPKKSGASSNRLVTALALGLPTAADNLESYREFSKVFIDIRSHEFRTMLRDPGSYNKLVAEAQASLVPRFSFENVKKAWCELV